MYFFSSCKGRYFDEISQDTGKYCFGVDDTLKALELGAVEILICWENLDIQRYVLKNHITGEEKILHLTPDQEKDKTHFNDKEVSPFVLHFLAIMSPLSSVLLFNKINNFREFVNVLQSSAELELVENQPLLEWLANNYKNFGATLEIITDRSQEGSQFVRGFGGIGGKKQLHFYFSFNILSKIEGRFDHVSALTAEVETYLLLPHRT